jgi:outer membrane protein assembly factor BamB
MTKPSHPSAGARLFALLSLLCWLPAFAFRADDWPQWRGLNRDGVWNESGIVRSIPPQGLVVRWRAPVGYGYSSPVVAGGRVYVTDSQFEGKKSRERLLCFDATTGNRLWDLTYDVAYPNWAFTPENEGRPTATPIVAGGKVYALGMLGHLHCLDAATGQVAWRKSLSADYGEVSAFPSPLIEGELLILVISGKPNASVVALDKNSGKEVWRALHEPRTNSSPIVVTAGGGGKRQLIVWTPVAVTSLDPATGKVYWRQAIKALADWVVSTPVVDRDRLLVGGVMLKLDSDQPGASVLWPQGGDDAPRVLSNTSTGVILGKCVYSARSTGQLVCLDAGTGKQLWETDRVTDLRTGSSIHITPNGDCAFLYTDRGDLIQARLSGKGYEELGRFRLIEPTYRYGARKCAWAAPAYANGCVVARSDEELVCVSLSAKRQDTSGPR